MLRAIPSKEKFFIFGFLALILFVYGLITYDTITLHLKNDFFLFHHAAYNFLHGQAVYNPIPEEIEWTAKMQKILHQNPNISAHSSNLTPPTFILCMLPLGFLTESSALSIWVISSLTVSCINVYLLYRIFFSMYHKPIIYWALLGMYLSSMPALANINLGQLGPFLLLTLIGIWQWAKKSHDIKAGLLLGLLLSVKYFFGLFLIFFLLQKRWRLLVASTVSFFVANSVAYLIFGKEAFLQYQQNLYHIYWYINNWNASLFGFLSRFSAHLNNLYFVPALWVKATYYCGCTLMLGIQIILCRKPLIDSQAFDYAFCYVLIACILMSPLGWLYYLVIMTIPILFIIQHIVSNKQKVFWPLLAFFMMLLLLNCPVLMRDNIHIGWRNISFFVANSFYSLLLLLGLLFYCAKKTCLQGPIKPTLENLIPWATIAYITASFSLLFMLFTALAGRLR